MSYECEKNIFYSFSPYTNRASILALSSTDYSFTYQSWNKTEENDSAEVMVFSSAVWSDPEGPEFLKQAAQMSETVRIQISMGAEFLNYEAQLEEFLSAGGAVDILIDRLISSSFALKLTALSKKYNLRLCYVVNRYFDVTQTLLSIPSELKERLVLIFLPPENKSSCYYSGDEVVKIIKGLDSASIWKFVIFKNIVAHLDKFKERDFFSSLSSEDYYDKPQAMQTYALFRKTVVWMTKKNWILLLDLIYALLVFLRDPKNYLRFRTWAGIRHTVYMTYVGLRYRIFQPTFYRGLHFIRYSLPHILRLTIHFLRYQLGMKAYHFLRYGIPHVCRMVFHFFRYQIGMKVYHFFRYSVPHVFRYVVHFSKYQIGMRVHHYFRYQFPSHLLFLIFPLRKIYWFSAYQFERRILPLFQRLGKDQ